MEFCFGAGNGYLQRTAVIQGEHTHEAAAIDMVVVISDDKGKRLHGSPGDKILHGLACLKPYIELPHIYPPRSYTKCILSCIIGRNPNQLNEEIITENLQFAIVGLDD